MKVRVAPNPDYADFDEIDPDAIGAEDSYMQGTLSFDELATLVGPEEASAMKMRRHGIEEGEDVHMRYLLDDIGDCE
jgi:hypothetical protein